ncbi:PhzF family phenazine biosynthesis protein [Proteinivorax hydrogeniformans]|uniref:PhzF family phenazine biosynthesis protein n=1 Tax=Proteinivorax hydrogeniformans TaxID=1826727 RepID=A0AAU8HWV4_9FIRM
MTKIHRLSAFAAEENGGNPAGVVLDADNLTEQQMKNIAAEVGYSETAFVSQSQSADFKVRFFTPTSEVDLCGHATIATFNLLRDLKIVLPNQTYTQQTKAGILKLKIDEQEVYMEQTKPKYLETINPEDMLSCFDNLQALVAENLPIQIISTGLREIFLPIKNLKALYNLKPHLKEISQVSKNFKVVGVHAFTTETLHKSSAHTRNFAPLYGINEESATGTANGALACYLNKHLTSNIESYTFEQGYSMEKPSMIKALIKVQNDTIYEVHVGGGAIKITKF